MHQSWRESKCSEFRKKQGSRFSKRKRGGRNHKLNEWQGSEGASSECNVEMDSEQSIVKTLTFSSPDSSIRKPNAKKGVQKVKLVPLSKEVFPATQIATNREVLVIPPPSPQNELTEKYSGRCLRKRKNGKVVAEKRSVVKKKETNVSQEKKMAKAKRILGDENVVSHLTAKEGTLARKRQLREMLEQQDDGYEDDAFQGTPFRNQKPIFTFKLSPIILGEDVELMEDHKHARYQTPRIKTPANHLRPVGPLSSDNSENDVMTPGLLCNVNRNNLDRYVNQLRKRKVRLGGKKVNSTIARPTRGTYDTQVIDKRLFNRRKSAETGVGDDEFEDYYWCDI